MKPKFDLSSYTTSDKYELKYNIHNFEQVYQIIDEDSKNENPPIISYLLIDLGSTDFSFQSFNNSEDVYAYFTIMKNISNTPMSQLFEKRSLYHFYKTQINDNVIQLLKQLFGSDFIKIDQLPLLYHISLYPNSTEDERENKSKRIYFFHGAYNIFYILFFDPFHKINPC